MALNLGNSLGKKLNPLGNLQDTSTPTPVAPTTTGLDYLDNIKKTGSDIQNRIDQHVASQTPSQLPVFDIQPAYDWKTAPSPFIKDSAPTQTGALSGQGVTQGAEPLPMTQGVEQPVVASMEGRKNVPSSMTDAIPKASAETNIIQQYLDDPKQDLDSKKEIMKAIDNGDEEAIMQSLQEGGYKSSEPITPNAEVPKEGMTDRLKFKSSEEFGMAEGAMDVLKFFANVPADSAQVIGGIWDAVTSPIETTTGIVKTAKGLSDKAVYATLNGIARQFGSKDVPPTVEAEMIDQMATGIKDKYGTLGKFKKAMVENPADTLLTFMPILGGVSKATRVAGFTETANKIDKLQSVINPVNVLKKEAQIATYPLKAVTPVTEYATKLATGIERETQQFIKKFPEVFAKAKKGEITRETLTKQVSSSIDKRLDELSETGKGYQDIITNEYVANKAEVTDLFKNTLKEEGYTKIGLPDKDRGAIAQVRKYVGEYTKNMTDKELFDLRKKVSSTISWDSGVSTEGQRIIKAFRAQLDGLAKERIPGLKEIDATYAPERTFLEKVKKDIFNKDGTLKDNAESIVANLTNLGKEGKLARIEKVSPGITQQVDALKAFEDVQKATSGKVGTYARGAVIGGTAMMASLPAAAATFIATYPPLAAKVLEIYGRTKNLGIDVINSLKTKIIGGEKLSQSEQQIMANAIKETPKESIINITKDGSTTMNGNLNTPNVQSPQVNPLGGLKSNPKPNEQLKPQPSAKEVQGTSGEIPKGYIRNPFNGKIEKINQSKKGSLNIGQIGKDLGIIKNIPEEIKVFEDIAKNVNNYKDFENIFLPANENLSKHFNNTYGLKDSKLIAKNVNGTGLDYKEFNNGSEKVGLLVDSKGKVHGHAERIGAYFGDIAINPDYQGKSLGPYLRKSVGGKSIGEPEATTKMGANNAVKAYGFKNLEDFYNFVINK